MNDEKEINMKKILLISDIYLTEINLLNNYWKFIKTLSKGQFLSNLDIIEIDNTKENSFGDEGILNIYDYEGNLKIKIYPRYRPHKI